MIERGSSNHSTGFADAIPNALHMPFTDALCIDVYTDRLQINKKKPASLLYAALLCLVLAVKFWRRRTASCRPFLDCNGSRLFLLVGLTALKQQDWTTFSEISTRFSQVNLFDVGREEAAISSCIKHKCVFTFFREALALRVQNHFSSITIKGG